MSRTVNRGSIRVNRTAIRSMACSNTRRQPATATLWAAATARDIDLSTTINDRAVAVLVHPGSSRGEPCLPY